MQFQTFCFWLGIEPVASSSILAPHSPFDPSPLQICQSNFLVPWSSHQSFAAPLGADQRA